MTGGSPRFVVLGASCETSVAKIGATVDARFAGRACQLWRLLELHGLEEGASGPVSDESHGNGDEQRTEGSPRKIGSEELGISSTKKPWQIV